MSQKKEFLKQSRSISITDEGISNCSKDVHSLKVPQSPVNDEEVKVTLVKFVQPSKRILPISFDGISTSVNEVQPAKTQFFSLVSEEQISICFNKVH